MRDALVNLGVASCLLLFTATLVACAAALAAQDAQAIGDAEKLCGFAYTHTDGGPISADTRACYCALHGVLGRNGISDDGGVAIRCQ